MIASLSKYPSLKACNEETISFISPLIGTHTTPCSNHIHVVIIELIFQHMDSSYQHLLGRIFHFLSTIQSSLK